MTFIWVPDKGCKMARIDGAFHNWLEQRTIRQPKALKKMRKISNEPLFGSFEEGSRFVFERYLASCENSLTKEYKARRK
jgi:hypothetical protein